MEQLKFENITSPNDLKSIVPQFIHLIKEYKFVIFEGEMGAGKTTLINEICLQLNVVDETSSPTFSIVNEYYSELLSEEVFHFDFYRIEEEDEALNIGIEEYFDSNKICLMEWASKISNLLPLKHLKIIVSLQEDGRRTIFVCR